ncbi:argininosuccinate lyase [Paraglaciecola sp. T6c]|uniref:Argininosuccinate lyase n=1 Tax=Pseudoalteromonas atlantica (strain T6c / ATCC BAA-1087) TaxID=3042615 RepID=ARLY_PSEA6|nr:argininosuccinate lyase [Paraglaciecola sp. T6c]Q15X84.1 RecName: Full=Argininosuccinate lyase; Short=ASAL; AltName: Full=Arginosuccinase [Paraglaciecola sp. T6c]ABG39504.1 argininosuccinate lyase [Paraglaciecola sp. T6c]
MSLWGGRFQDGSSAMFRTVNDSLPFDRVLASQDIRGSIAWARAIAKAGVLNQDEHQQLEEALKALLVKADAGELDFDASSEEDIHSFVEATLIEQLGDVARKLHTGRSRNDQVATDFRLWTREHVDLLVEDVEAVIASLVGNADVNQDVILPGYTHLQRAQPVRYPHWCLAYVEMLKRDLSRLHDLKARLNQCPLGSGALAGTTYPIDRQAIAEELGFDSPCINSLDAVSDRDYVLELLFVASTSMMHLSRMAEDLIFYNSGEAGFIQLGDAVTSGSSLMPQKKNPDALELMRGKCGRVFGSLQALLVTMKGLPLAYNKDMQEDKEGLFDATNQWHICLRIACEVVDSIKLDSERCAKAAREGYANATELADYLVDKGIPFRTAHDISGRVVLDALEKKKAIEELTIAELKVYSDVIEEDVYPVLQLEYLVNKRDILGGTGIKPVLEALANAKASFKK